MSPTTPAPDWSHWGPLQTRYREARPRRILSLDGGGIRGLMTLQVLQRLEDLLRERGGGSPDYRLCDTFDLIGGTSTGAIIATGLARGMSVTELVEFYRAFGREAFDKRSLLFRWMSLYGKGALASKLREVFGKHSTLEPEHLRTLLVVVTRNATTDSAWPISSNPAARYNHPERSDCNLRIPLWQLVRASTAAPVFFPPEVIDWDPTHPDKAFVFVDGGTTTYNNPAFLLTRMATEPAYKLDWARGERNLAVVSLGTGGSAALGADSASPEVNIASNVGTTLSALMSQAAYDQDVNCRTVGRCTHGGFLDRELRDLVPLGSDGQALPLSEDLGRNFLYARYDVELSTPGLSALGLGHLDPKLVSKLDSVDAMHDLEAIGRKLAEQVDLAHLGRW